MLPQPSTIEVPNDQLPAVVTCLQMLEPPHKFGPSEHALFSLSHHPTPDLDWYLELYTHVGADWLWSWRLSLPQNELARIVNDGLVDVFSLRYQHKDEGLLELDFRKERECELKLLGISSTLFGKGAGLWLLRQALRIGWSRAIDRMWLHTCSMDHPAALNFYMKSGFVPYRRYVEIAPDPRSYNLLSPEAGRHVPILAAGRPGASSG
jgi:GNAT superfamily N-acetyltransferase